MIIHSELWIDILGWMGAAAVVVAYALVSTRRVSGDSTGYQLLNLVGSIFLIINTVHYGAYPSTLVNVVWLGIAVYAIATYSSILRQK